MEISHCSIFVHFFYLRVVHMSLQLPYIVFVAVLFIDTKMKSSSILALL